MPKTNRYVLSTRPLPEAVLAKAQAQNICIEVLPFIKTKPMLDAQTEAHIYTLFQTPIVAVFTSSNAVHAVAQLFQKPIGWNIYCLQNATAKAVAQLFQIPIVAIGSNAAALADAIVKKGEREIYFFCGNLRHEALPERLRRENVLVHEVVVYNTIETPVVVHKEYDAVLFYSPSAVHSFFSTNKIDTTLPLFAIGATTAEAIRQQVANPVISADKPDTEMLIQQVIAYFNKQNAAHE